MRSTFAWIGLMVVANLTVASIMGGEDKPAQPQPPEIAPPAQGAKEEPKKAVPVDVDPKAIEVHFADGSVMKMTIQEDSFEITTAAGKKTVKLAEVRKIQLMPRLADEDSKKINAAIKDLSSDAFKERQRATAELVRFGIKAYPALVVATENGDAETRKRAEQIIETLKSTLPEEMFDLPTKDALWTKEGKLVGKIEQATWKVNTTQFGALQVKLGDVRGVRWVGYPDPETDKIAAQPDPGSVDALAAQIGKVFAFKVTGATDGSVWGTGTYTSDSRIAKAAVHAGLLKVGETKVVKVRIVQPLNAYTSSTQNGITTGVWGRYDGAYEFVK